VIEKNKEFKRVKLTHPIGYLLKPFTEEELMSTLEIALFTHENKNINRLPILEILNKKIITPLSTREYDILNGIFQGHSNQEIAQLNFVSINTIKSHVRSIYSKMNVGSRWELLIKLRSVID
jgi:DNA-binding NarL/FixJ family response regulator